MWSFLYKWILSDEFSTLNHGHRKYLVKTHPFSHHQELRFTVTLSKSYIHKSFRKNRYSFTENNNIQHSISNSSINKTNNHSRATTHFYTSIGRSYSLGLPSFILDLVVVDTSDEFWHVLNYTTLNKYLLNNRRRFT